MPVLLRKRMRQGFNSGRQRGTVLITVLLVVAFVVILVTEVNKTVNYQANLNRNLMNRDQAYSYLIGMEELAKIYLKKAFDAEKEETVHLGQAWAQQDITFPIDGGVMTASIVDMQSCFNLNSIAVLDKQGNQGNQNTRTPNNAPTGVVVENNQPRNTPQPRQPDQQNQVTAGELILTSLIEKLSENTNVNPSALAAATRDWIDSDVTPSGPDGVEDLYYQGLDYPYLPPNGIIAHPSELRIIKDFDKFTYQSILPYVCVLPSSEVTQINVNTIPAERSALLYAALDGKVDQQKVEQIISQRPEDGYELQDFWDQVGSVALKSSLKNRLGNTSKYFQMNAKAEINRTRVYMKTLFEKKDDNQFKVVSRYFGKE
jgi:general secretion pathway protein K